MSESSDTQPTDDRPPTKKIDVRAEPGNAKLGAALMEIHPTQSVPLLPTALAVADVDVAMVPVVSWLNSYASVRTLFSCQGGPYLKNVCGQTSEGNEQSYVLFTCANPIDLICILSVLRGHAKTTVEWHELRAQLEYTARFHNGTELACAINAVENMTRYGQRRRVTER